VRLAGEEPLIFELPNLVPRSLTRSAAISMQCALLRMSRPCVPRSPSLGIPLADNGP
jgi:hypothetical protein